jgi:hypothetical protein
MIDPADARNALEVGRRLRLFFNAGNINNRLLHVRAVVDGDWYVLRWWSERMQRWIYQVEPIEYFEVSAEHLTLEGWDSE